MKCRRGRFVPKADFQTKEGDIASNWIEISGLEIQRTFNMISELIQHV